MPTNTKGSRRERELVDLIYEEGFGVMRAPASGSATERELPDVIAGNGEYLYAIEAKASQRGDAIYLDEKEIEDLQFFAEKFGGYARVGARYDYNDWAFFNPNALHRTPGGNYRVKEEDLTDGQTLAELADGPL